jgi:hypothetical protein
VAAQAKLPISFILYRLSLEAPGHWFMTIGTGLQTKPPYLNIGQLEAFIRGFSAGSGTPTIGGDDGFFQWLRDEAGDFPGEGWARAYLQRSNGDHFKAIRILFDHLHSYLLETRPAWFVRFNQEPQPSMVQRGTGQAVSNDVRLPAHVATVTGQEIVSPPDIRLSAFELADGYTLFLGLPSDVGTWWSGTGRRVAQLGSASTLAAVRGNREPLESFVAKVRSVADPTVDACVMEAEEGRASVWSCGKGGAVHLRAGAIIGKSTAGAIATWSTQAHDKVLLLTPAVFAVVKDLDLGPLPAKLASGAPIAWTQSSVSAERRLAVAVTWYAPQ